MKEGNMQRFLSLSLAHVACLSVGSLELTLNSSPLLLFLLVLLLVGLFIIVLAALSRSFPLFRSCLSHYFLSGVVVSSSVVLHWHSLVVVVAWT